MRRWLAVVLLLVSGSASAFELRVGPAHTFGTSQVDHAKLGVAVGADLGKGFEAQALLAGVTTYAAVNPGSQPIATAPDAGESRSGTAPFYAHGLWYPGKGGVRWGFGFVHFASNFGTRAGGLPLALSVSPRIGPSRGLSFSMPIGVDLIFNRQLNLLAAPEFVFQMDGFLRPSLFARAVVVKTSAYLFALPSLGFGVGF